MRRVQQVLKTVPGISTSKNGGGSFEPVIPEEDCNGETARKRTESMCLSVRRKVIRFNNFAIQDCCTLQVASLQMSEEVYGQQSENLIAEDNYLKRTLQI